MTRGPKPAVGDGALGFRKALNKAYPGIEHQRCRVRKTANVLNKLLKSMQPKVKAELHEIWMAETREDAEQAFEYLITLLIHNQLEQIENGDEPDTFLNPEELANLEKQTLRECFQLIANLFEIIEKSYRTERVP